MSVVYLIGDPVAHSLSPAMQNAAFAALGLPHLYELLRVPAADLEGAVRRVRRDDVLGANVTIPHKERVGRFLDGTEDAARRIGAVNTLFKRSGRLLGENTDAGGFADALAERGVDVAGRRVLLLGAGGAARACLDHLVRSAAHVHLADRTSQRAVALGRDFAGMFGDATLTYEQYADPRAVARQRFAVLSAAPRSVDAYEVVVNATSLGMHGEEALSGVDLPPSLTVVDVVATSRETPLVVRARAAGCVVVDGLLMLLHQGARAFRLWTGVDAPLAAMRAALPREV